MHNNFATMQMTILFSPFSLPPYSTFHNVSLPLLFLFFLIFSFLWKLLTLSDYLSLYYSRSMIGDSFGVMWVIDLQNRFP